MPPKDLVIRVYRTFFTTLLRTIRMGKISPKIRFRVIVIVCAQITVHIIKIAGGCVSRIVLKQAVSNKEPSNRCSINDSNCLYLNVYMYIHITRVHTAEIIIPRCIGIARLLSITKFTRRILALCPQSQMLFDPTKIAFLIQRSTTLLRQTL